MKQAIRSLVLAASIAALGYPVLAANNADSNVDCAKLSDKRLSAEEVVALVRQCAPDAPASQPQKNVTAQVDTFQGDSVEDLPGLVPPAVINAPVANAPITNTPVANSPIPADPNRS